MPGLDRYHGYDAMRTHWPVLLQRLICSENFQISVQIKKRGRGVGGWSKNNPYLEV